MKNTILHFMDLNSNITKPLFSRVVNVKPHKVTLENIEKVQKMEAKLIVNQYFLKNVIRMNPDSASYLYFNKLY